MLPCLLRGKLLLAGELLAELIVLRRSLFGCRILLHGFVHFHVHRPHRFPQRVNAGFMQIVDQHAIKLRVFERGSGETLACGTGACAAAVAGIRRGLLASPVRVTTRGGDLTIAWGGPGRPVLMTGPAVTVFSGEIEL